MSGKPNEEGVKELQQAFRDFDRTRYLIAELRKSIAEAQKSLQQREGELRGLTTLIEDKMQQMDVHSKGNAGYEARRFELLLMMSQI